MSDLREIDASIRRRHLLKHPFYQSWSRGELSRSTLQEYATQYYQFEVNFPRYVAGAYSKISDPAQRRTLLENLVDEEGRSPTHPELWLNFARALGIGPVTVKRARTLAATLGLCRNYERLTFGPSAAAALGALYAYESIFPEVATEKSRGLRAFYGIEDPHAHEFFRVHTSADVAHARAERELLRSVIDRQPASGRAARRATDTTLAAWWSFLNAFCERGAAAARPTFAK